MTTRTPEGVFKKRFCETLKKLGCIPIQFQQTAATPKGFPDTMVILPESLVIFIEFKAHKNSSYRPGQKLWLDRLNERNIFAFACYPENADTVLAQIKELL